MGGMTSLRRSARPFRFAAIFAITTSALLLAGCTGTPDAAPSTDAPSVGTTTLPPQPEQYVNFEVHPGSAEDGFVGAKDDVEVSTCEEKDGSWAFGGTVTNPTDAVQSYRIYVTVKDAANATKALVQVNANDVEAGTSTEWSGTAPVTGDLTCSTRVERFTPADDEG